MSTTVHGDRPPVTPGMATRVVSPEQLPAARSASYKFLRPPGGPGEIGRIGDYRVLRLLGAGGMGKVFLAEDLTLRRTVALKVMCLPPGEDLQSGCERFLREARALAAINHSNLVTVYQTGHDHGTVYLAMELLEGETLDARIRRSAPLETNEILTVAAQIATGLAAIHERGLIHRDIKPSNIWLMSHATQDTEPLEEDDSEEPARPVSCVKILDFGLVREVNADTQLTEVGVVVGTPAYMSPEQVRGRHLDVRTDLFSFGCVLYAMATGRMPFDATTPMAQAAALAADEPVRARKLNPAIPKALSELIAELLAKEPEERPQSAADVIDRLRQIATGGDSPLAASRARFPRRYRHAILSVGALWLITGVLLAVAFARNADTAPEAKSPPPAAGEPQHDFLRGVRKLDERVFPPPGEPQPPGVDGSVSVGGVRSPQGIFMHCAPPFLPRTFASFALDQQYTRFITEVALNDTARPRAEVIFVVYADGAEVWRSRPISRGNCETCEVNVQGVTVLALEVFSLGPEMGAHGAWIEPRLTK